MKFSDHADVKTWRASGCKPAVDLDKLIEKIKSISVSEVEMHCMEDQVVATAETMKLLKDDPMFSHLRNSQKVQCAQLYNQG